MPSINAFHDTWKDKGVTVLALSQEGKGVVHRFVDEHDIRYPVAIDPGGKTTRAYGVRGYPTAFVIDPDGAIAWRGHPADEDGLVSAVRDALKTAVFVALPEDPPKRLEKAVAEAAKGHYGKACTIASRYAHDADEALAEAARDLAEDIDVLVEKQLERAERRVKHGAYHDAVSGLRHVETMLEGCNHEDAIHERIHDIETLPEAKDDLAAGRSLEKILKKIGSVKPAQAAARLRSLLKEYPETAVADRAREILENL